MLGPSDDRQLQNMHLNQLCIKLLCSFVGQGKILFPIKSIFGHYSGYPHKSYHHVGSVYKKESVAIQLD